MKGVDSTSESSHSNVSISEETIKRVDEARQEEKRTKTGCWRALFLPCSDHRTGKQFAYGVRYVIIEEIF